MSEDYTITIERDGVKKRFKVNAMKLRSMRAPQAFVSKETFSAMEQIDLEIARGVTEQRKEEDRQRIDERAVDELGSAQCNELARKRNAGYSGWESHAATQQSLSDLFHAQVAKGNVVGAANYLAFLHARGEAILPASNGAAASESLEYSEPWQHIDAGDLDDAERMLIGRLPQLAAFIPRDAHTLANISLHCIREVRATRAALAALQLYEEFFEQTFAQACSNGLFDAWREPIDCSKINEAHQAAEAVFKQQDAEITAIGNLKDHQVAQLVNELRSCAMQFHDQGQLRERIAHIVRPIFEQSQSNFAQRDISDYEVLEAAMKGLEASGKSARSVALALLKPDAIRKIVKAVNEAAR